MLHNATRSEGAGAQSGALSKHKRVTKIRNIPTSTPLTVNNSHINDNILKLSANRNENQMKVQCSYTCSATLDLRTVLLWKMRLISLCLELERRLNTGLNTTELGKKEKSRDLSPLLCLTRHYVSEQLDGEIHPSHVHIPVHIDPCNVSRARRGIPEL